ncbi:voltage-gated potassium channel [Aureococcus anophagefferens]|nr:voltage-gated potassium channel [Aureococcus anophagefferens]
MVLSPDYSNRALAAGLRREQKMARRPTNPMELSVSDAASLGRISHAQTQARRQQSNVIRPTSLNRKTERRYSKVHHHAAPKASQRTMVNSLRAMHEEKSELEHQETASFSRETLKQISVIRTRLRHDTSHVLDPSGPYMRRWDLVTTFCLVFTAIVTPVEVGFVVQARPNPRTPLFWINRAIDCVFLKDIVLNFNLAYVDDTKGNMLVKSRRTIAKRWIKQLEHSKRDADGNKQFHGASVADCYFASLYFTVYTITSVGYGDINPVNRTEMVVNTLFIVTGAIIWAYIIGNFASLLSTVDVYGAQFRQSMDELNVMMAERNFPVSLRKRCRTFFRQSRNMARVANYRKLEGMMSYALRGEAAAANNLMWLKRLARVRFAVAFYTVKSCLIRLGREHHRRAMVEAGLDPDEEDSKKVSAFEHLYMRKGHKIAAHTSSMAEVRPSVILNPVKVAPGRQSDAPPPAELRDRQARPDRGPRRGRVVRRFTGRGSMVASRPAIAIEETKAAEKRRRTRRSSFLPS